MYLVGSTGNLDRTVPDLPAQNDLRRCLSVWVGFPVLSSVLSVRITIKTVLPLVLLFLFVYCRNGEHGLDSLSEKRVFEAVMAGPDKVITLCGNTRFMGAFPEARKRLGKP